MMPGSDGFPLPQPSSRSSVEIYRMWSIYKAVNQRLRAGGAVVNLLVGEPSFPPPAKAVAAAQAAMAGPVGYTETLGIRPLRQGIADLYRRRHGLDIPAERIAVTIGTSSGFMLAFLAAFEAGQKVAVVEPCYPAYRGTLKALNLTPHRIGTDAANGFRPRVQDIEALPADIAGLVLASPANPTGTLLPAADLAEIYAACRRRGLWLVVDELYHGIVYGQPAPTILGQGPEAIVINGFSKYWGMTGWRIGWLVLPERLVPRVEALAGSLQISAPYLSQVAALAALECEPEMEQRLALYAANRQKLLQALPGLGLNSFAPPDGAFYLYCNISHLADDSVAFCQRMLDETGVVAAPGVDFDSQEGHRFIRFSFSVEAGTIDQALQRLGEWLPRQARRG
ncbi:pyridoxal phosphate-dependent aminotransferase [Ferrovibrio sp.]|uniref:pyridoxal phosphate-dependent aminotransferase n=1 Tax=Ferrovibrio sp. TaxID=1917215 RepID=UPI0025C023A5|nr:pyridoxal phosphate-dependent aminotransferase [Ferrovibrio sp.]MBX3455361.1 pyridoxal phosphate-dependent aminotransferase [Ferrovibrio sp.]